MLKVRISICSGYFFCYLCINLKQYNYEILLFLPPKRRRLQGGSRAFPTGDLALS